MSSTTLVSVEEYLATSYRPDRDFVDGELQERNLGELEHSLLQTAVAVWFWTRQKEWNVLPIVEQRVQVAATRFRILDVSVLLADQPREPIITTPPLILIEILSKDDSLRSMRERVDDYLNFGVKHVWILDPATRRAYVCSRTGFQEPESGVLTVPGTPIRLVLNELFQQVEPAS
ncbi:MAG: Uma2 family endonuclease [Candidatus Korobacteraceae bacterium]|jgi:Uma2 family endonuclease